MVEERGRGIVNIQLLRGVAALMVVVYHLFPQMSRMGWQGPEVRTLSAGVDLFFVISGFIMWHTTAQKPGRTMLEFYRDRLLRIVPLYWLLSAAILAVLLVAPSALQTVRYDLWHVVASFLFLSAVNPADGSLTPLLIPGWTLNYEMFFYLIFGAALALTQRPGARAAIILGALAGLAALRLVAPPGGLAAFYTDAIMLEFGYGILIAMTFRLVPSPIFGAASLVFGALLLAANPISDAATVRAVAYGLPCAFIVLGALLLPDLNLRALTLVGDASYSLYLSHFLTMSAAGQLWRRLDAPVALFPLFGIGLCVALGLAVYWLVERPLGRLTKSLVRPHPASASGPGVVSRTFP